VRFYWDYHVPSCTDLKLLSPNSRDKELSNEVDQTNAPKAYSKSVTYPTGVAEVNGPQREFYLRQDIQSIAPEDSLHGLTAAN